MTLLHPPAGAEDRRPEWRELLRRPLERGTVTAAYQAIVDVARGVVVGYEALARFPGPTTAGPLEWFAAARRLGLAADLEAAALSAALLGRPHLPRNCFLTVNVSPDLLDSAPVRRVFEAEGDLGGLVVELTEQTPIDSYRSLEPHLNRLRAAGALIAVDDAGAGYAGLTHLLGLRPSIIKLDRGLVEGIDRDEAKRALLEMIGVFAG